MIKNVIVDGDGTGTKLKVFDEGSIGVVHHRHPPIEEPIFARQLRQYFTDTGISSGSNDMTVNGSSTAVEFSIDASPDYDYYLKTISVVIGDGGSPALNKYGALSALTNGVKWSLINQDEGEYDLHEGIKTNLEFIRVGNDTHAIGTGTDAYLADVSGGGTERSYLPLINLETLYGPPYGIRLRKGTTDRLIFTVQDDLTGLTTHNAIAYGVRI